MADNGLKPSIFRPDVESCNDAPHIGLVSEINAIQQNVDELNEVKINKDNKIQNTFKFKKKSNLYIIYWIFSDLTQSFKSSFIRIRY